MKTSGSGGKIVESMQAHLVVQSIVEKNILFFSGLYADTATVKVILTSSVSLKPNIVPIHRTRAQWKEETWIHTILAVWNFIYLFIFTNLQLVLEI